MSTRSSNPTAMEATGHVLPSLTLGIDLASQPERTAACLIDWAGPRGRLLPRSDERLDDDRLLGLLLDERVAKAAIDAPFGWPSAFIDAIGTYQSTGNWLPLEAAEIRFRVTEIRVAQETGQQPLSAATDDLVWPTMRCARLLSQLPGQPLDRSGGGRVLEVYPAAALRRWLGTPTGTMPSYKGKGDDRTTRRREIVGGLKAHTAETLEISPDWEEACVDDDNVLDALVCALIARAAEVGQVDAIPRGSRWAAVREGWIVLPTADALSAA